MIWQHGLIVIETKIRGVWTRHDIWTTKVDCDPEDMHHKACEVMGALVADGNWPGTEARARWNETGLDGGEIAMYANDACLDLYIIEARDQLAAYAEAQRYAFRNA